MSKIIKLDGDKVLIGTDKGKIKKVMLSELNFEPEIGDEVEIFESDDSIIISKKDFKEKTNNNSNININLNNPYGSYNSRSVNKVIYCLLALFLGGIGIHNIYAGKNGAGIACFLFCWTVIPFIISIIVFIVGLCKKADSNGNIIV